MLCPSCHSELTPGLTACPSCGTALISTQMSDEKTVIQDPPVQHASSPKDVSTPNIEDVSTNIYDADHSAVEQISGDAAVPSKDEEKMLQNEDLPTLKVAAVTGNLSGYIPPAQPPVASGNTAAPNFVPSQPLPTGTGGRRGHLSTSMLLIVVLLIFAGLLFIENGGIIVFGAVYLPAQTNARATVAAQPQSTVDTQATSSAQQMKTAQAQTTASVQQSSQAQDTADQQPNTIYTQSTNGIKVFDDTLNNPNTSLWSAQQYDGGSCAFSNGAYHAVAYSTNTFSPCDLPVTLKNFAFQVQMTITAGDEGGLIFHSNLSTNQFYYLAMDAATGDYNLELYKDNNVDHTQLLQSGFMPTFKIGANQANLVTVITRGSNIYLYINKQFVFNVLDNKYTTGTLSLIASDDTKSTDVAFTDAQLWLLLN